MRYLDASSPEEDKARREIVEETMKKLNAEPPQWFKDLQEKDDGNHVLWFDHSGKDPEVIRQVLDMLGHRPSVMIDGEDYTSADFDLGRETGEDDEELVENYVERKRVEELKARYNMFKDIEINNKILGKEDNEDEPITDGCSIGDILKAKLKKN